jgi:CRP-like cAMP-binding protein
MKGVTMKELEMQLLLRCWDRMYSERTSRNDWARVLATFSLFRGISRRRLRKLVRHATFVEHAPGNVIIHRDVPSDSLYVIVGGTAMARRGAAARSLHVGDYFGEAGLLNGGPGAATVVATEELHVMRLPWRSYVRIAQHAPTISFARLRNVGARLRRLETKTAGC